MDDARPRNRLAQETSPYLLQHATNPVDWYPWGPEALARAQREDKPILLSIGYAACHWCHVMERESFQDDAIAQRMNDRFVCIKVDREERPDLDEIYMTATMALSGSGGWPMTVFLTPDQRPFFAGTYYPPTGRHGRPGFADLLDRIAELWQGDRAALLDQANQLTAQVRTQSAPTPPGSVDDGAIVAAVEALDATFDTEYGGFGGAPKFPPVAALQLLLRHHHRTGAERSLRMVRATLDGMKNGGIYDHVGGGFARYSTDRRWLVPHFEKMLYDNAGLARVYLEAYQVTGEPEYRRVAHETLDYVAREMQGEAGGYYSATDADSEGEEGRYFVWTRRELDQVLGRADGERFAAYYAVTESGNWEGKNILNTPRSLAVVAATLGIDVDQLGAALARARKQVLEARARRVAPLLDDKVITSWNGLMIGTMAEGHRVFREHRYLSSARRAAAFLRRALVRDDGGLHRTWRGGRAHLPGYLEDYAFVGDGLLDLYEAAGDEEDLKTARGLAERMLADFADEAQGDFYQTARSHEALVARPREGHDGALPSANAVAARLLARLSFHTGRTDLRDHALRAIRAHARQIERLPRAFSTTLGVVDLLLTGPVELVFSGGEGDEGRRALEAEVARHFLPHRVIGHVFTSDPPPGPLLEGKGLCTQARLYVCRDYACQAPVDAPEQVAAALGAQQQNAFEQRQEELALASLPGRATPEGTRRFATRQARASAYRPLGATGVLASSIGFGGYRILESDNDHRRALTRALGAGVNLVDTSTNYGGGSSESLVGQVLADVVGGGLVARDEIVVVSKVGYVQGRDLDEARRRAAAGDPLPEMVEYDEAAWHSIHPQWIEQQLCGSLRRLGLETLDVCLLHNPEYFLLDAERRGAGSIEQRRAEFARRLEEAFAQLEREVARGRVAAYGVSSNTLARDAVDPGATGVEQFLRAAEAAGGPHHHLRVVQLPLNLLESQGAAPDRAIARARAAGLGVLVNRPLNAILPDGLLRLADPPALAVEPPELAPLLDRVVTSEDEFRQVFAPALRTTEGQPAPAELFDWGRRLDELAGSLSGIDQWREIEHEVVRPHARQVLASLDRAMQGSLRPRWLGWRQGYVRTLEELLVALRLRATEQTSARLVQLRRCLQGHLEGREGASLAQLAVWVVGSVPGVTTVLAGMRQEGYVAELTEVMQWAELGNARSALEAAVSMP